ncbi:MAG: hypothetical protein H5T64_10530 [Chloroflexi bacterium]|nr:hypothetical protein [Chloroflexota bacterium]
MGNREDEVFDEALFREFLARIRYIDLMKCWCPNRACAAFGVEGKGNFVRDGYSRAYGTRVPRLRCTVCGKRFSYLAITAYHHLRASGFRLGKLAERWLGGARLAELAADYGRDKRTIRKWVTRGLSLLAAQRGSSWLQLLSGTFGLSLLSLAVSRAEHYLADRGKRVDLMDLFKKPHLTYYDDALEPLVEELDRFLPMKG